MVLIKDYTKDGIVITHPSGVIVKIDVADLERIKAHIMRRKQAFDECLVSVQQDIETLNSLRQKATV